MVPSTCHWVGQALSVTRYGHSGLAHHVRIEHPALGR